MAIFRVILILLFIFSFEVVCIFEVVLIFEIVFILIVIFISEVVIIFEVVFSLGCLNFFLVCLMYQVSTDIFRSSSLYVCNIVNRQFGPLVDRSV